jgi:hypothetical protein
MRQHTGIKAISKWSGTSYTDSDARKKLHCVKIEARRRMEARGISGMALAHAHTVAIRWMRMWWK